MCIKLAAILCLSQALPTIVFADGDQSMRFNNRTIQGTWGFSSGVGFIGSPNTGMSSLIVAAGVVTFDGKGNCEVTPTANIDGTLFGPVKSDSCTYSVEPNGTGSSIAFFSEPGAPESSAVSFVIVDHGKEIRFINTDALIGSFIAKRQ